MLKQIRQWKATRKLLKDLALRSNRMYIEATLSRDFIEDICRDVSSNNNIEIVLKLVSGEELIVRSPKVKESNPTDEFYKRI